jgi:hypothetical protein
MKKYGFGRDLLVQVIGQAFEVNGLSVDWAPRSRNPGFSHSSLTLFSCPPAIVGVSRRSL